MCNIHWRMCENSRTILILLLATTNDAKNRNNLFEIKVKYHHLPTPQNKPNKMQRNEKRQMYTRIKLITHTWLYTCSCVAETDTISYAMIIYVQYKNNATNRKIAVSFNAQVRKMNRIDMVCAWQRKRKSQTE